MVERLSFSLVPSERLVPFDVVEESVRNIRQILMGIERTQLQKPRARTRIWYLENKPSLLRYPTFDLVAYPSATVPRRVMPSGALFRGVQQLAQNTLQGPPHRLVNKKWRIYED